MRKYLIMAVMLMGILGILTGCGRKKYEPAPIPEGVELTGFYLHHEGMVMEPYYILKVTDKGTFMKVTNQISGEDYFQFADTILEEETACLKLLTDETAVEKLEEIISEAGAVGWNGFDEAVKKKNALDSGDRYQLYMELSDGTVISVHGYNTCPEGFEDLLKKTEELFSDYCYN